MSGRAQGFAVGRKQHTQSHGLCHSPSREEVLSGGVGGGEPDSGFGRVKRNRTQNQKAASGAGPGLRLVGREQCSPRAPTCSSQFSFSLFNFLLVGQKAKPEGRLQ